VGIEYKSLPSDDPKIRRPDINKAKRVLGWEPQVDFDEGLTRTIEYFKRKSLEDSRDQDKHSVGAPKGRAQTDQIEAV
jgi:dTDP-D-glucose 4,6-dehydratase